MRILAIEPYFGLSHKSFLEGYQKRSSHDVEIWSLPARKWKWRMRGSAYHFARLARERAEKAEYDVLLVSDFLNLADFVAMAPPRLRDLPRAVYFHENQITYPLGEHAPVDFHYGWINVSTAMSADRVIFNSHYHRREFFDAVLDVFERMPDYVPRDFVEQHLEQSTVLPVGIDFEEHDRVIECYPSTDSSVLRILWNHRWEYDKGPDMFFSGLCKLRDQGVPFRLTICGEAFKKQPPIFEQARVDLADRIDHMGFFPDPGDYLKAVRQSDIVVSTSIHEFFGVSIVEAMYLGCLPVLPKRLSYPEIVPPHLHPLFLYEKDEDFAPFLRNFIENPPRDYGDELRESVAQLDWRNLGALLDRELESLVYESLRKSSSGVGS